MSTSSPDPGPTSERPQRGSYSLSNVAMRGVVCTLPGDAIGNEAFADQFSPQALADVVKMIGVEARHWAAPDQTSADLCFLAAQQLLERLNWQPDSIDALIFVSQTPDHVLPASSCLLHGRLKLAPDCQALDVNLGCSGYVYGLWLASSLIQSGCRRILLLAGETSSRLVDPTDRGTAVLFGDAGSATALEYDKAAPSMTFRLGTEGAGAQALIVPQGGFRALAPDHPMTIDPTRLHMDGGQVFAFTLRVVPKLIKDTLAAAKVTGETVEAYLLHQANRFMLRHIGKKIGADNTQLPINIERYGNTSCVTIPLLLADDMAPRLKVGPVKVMMVGFGVGLSWGAVLADLGPLVCAEVISA
jgi:3-oxoacyl-[acyl-carrier-protein] synthase-3